MESTKTLVVGASTKPERYAYKAIVKLLENQHQVIAYGNRGGEVEGVVIETSWNSSWEVDTVTMYVGPANQAALMGDIVKLNPRRVIFNPGTENAIFFELLDKAGISYEEACTLVLLSTGEY